jgi:oxygen-independent coproporphyrinogen-3 oxidase
MDDVLRLVKRYAVRAPRYTSYPSTADFHAGVGSAELAAAIGRSNEDTLPAPVSLYVHLPYRRTLCFYCACNKIVTRDTQRAHRYLDLITVEAALLAPLLARDRSVTRIHLGGGTPTYYRPAELRGLLDTLGETFTLAPEEKTDRVIEIDPRTVTTEDIAALHELGFNRLSFGVQDLDPLVQKTVNQHLTPEALEMLVVAARGAGFHSLNFDLIYGLPQQTLERFDETLAWVIRLRPDCVALYSYTHLPDRFRAQKLLDSSALPLSTQRLILLVNAIAALTSAGYEYIGMDHFALPDDALSRSRRAGTLVRNFQGYVPGPDTDLLGLGAGTTSSLGGVYVQNTRTVSDWEAAISAGHPATARGYVLNADDLIRRDVIGSVMCRDEIPFAEFENRHGISFNDYFGTSLARLEQPQRDGLIRRTHNALEITPLGRLFLHAIAMAFDAHLRLRNKTAASNSS